MNKFESNLTSGSVARNLIKFSTPFLISNIIQAFYSVADMLIVSWFNGAEAVSGVSNGGQVTMLVASFVIGLTVAGTVLVGQYFGAGKKEEVKKTIGTLFSVLMLLSVFFTVVMIIASGPILKMMNVPAESFGHAQSYFNICMLGTFFIFGYNAISSILRGLGDSKRPLYFVTIACVTNIILDVILVGPLGMGAAGAAVATIVAQGISMLLSVAYLMRNDFVFDFKKESFKIDREKAKLLIKMGIPSSIQNMVTSVSFMLMMTLVNGYGVYASAAMGIVGKFNSFAILPAIAMSSSISSMAAQNLGAGLPERAKETMKVGIKIAFPISATFFIAALVFPEAILSIFSQDARVIEEGLRYIRTFSFDYLVVPFTFCINGLIMGAGHTTFTMINNMVSAVFLRIPVAVVFGSVLGWGLMGIGLAAPVASGVAGIACFWYYKTNKWQKIKLSEKQETQEVAVVAAE